MEFQKLFPTADDVVSLEPDQLGIRMLPVLRNWPEQHNFDLREMLTLVADTHRTDYRSPSLLHLIQLNGDARCEVPLKQRGAGWNARE